MNYSWYAALQLAQVLFVYFRDHRAQDASHLSFESRSQNPSFKDPGGSSQTDDPVTVATDGKESSVHWAPRSSPYSTAGQDEQNAYPYLPTVLEEPGSSFSEGEKLIWYMWFSSQDSNWCCNSLSILLIKGISYKFGKYVADDDPLPAIDSLQISGDAYPGNELLASGYSINGTTTCNFEVHIDSFIL